MEIDIKCLECSKGTRKHDIGGVIYCIDKPSNGIILINKIICPKCKKDISEGKCLVKGHEFLMSCIAANICVMAGEKVPVHLQKALPANKKDFEMYKMQYNGRLKITE